VPTYELEIQIDEDLVQKIDKADQQIVITKQVAGSGSPLVWLTFPAFQMTTVTWEDKYKVYASNVQLQHGATIKQMASLAADARCAYALETNVFEPDAPQSTLGSGTYEVINGTVDILTFGLSQAATLNHNHHIEPVSSAIFAATLLPGQWLDMTPTETVSVFLFNRTQNSMCLGTVMGPALTVPFGGSTTHQKITFDFKTGGFSL
jgi:hypothetical protein